LYGFESKTGTYKFEILPPCYRTWWAYSAYMILLIVLIWIIVKLNTRRLIEAKIRLEGIVKERTAEISQQNEEILTQNEMLNQQKEEIQVQNESLFQQKEEIQTQNINLKSAYAEINLKNATLNQKNEEIQTQNEHLKDAYEEINTKNEKIQVQHKKLSNAYEKISFINEQMTASVRYASNIQTAMLPFEETIEKLFNNFVLYRPKDIVSGDFYWVGHLPSKPGFAEKKIIAVADCTGHGVPGAFMSMIGIRILDMIIFERDVIEPCEILKHANLLTIKTLKQNVSENKDGMDMIIISVEKTEDDFLVKYSGAKRPLFYSNPETGEIVRMKATRKSIGGKHQATQVINYEQEELFLKKDTVLYLSSDGYIDQNGPDKKRFGSALFLETLNKINKLQLKEQLVQLERKLDEYQGNYDQRDDITVVGIKL
jgi:serine phosphatase RsbU (regulator of sigma subunit)